VDPYAKYFVILPGAKRFEIRCCVEEYCDLHTGYLAV